MKARWGDASAFRADPTAGPAARPSRGQSIALVAILVLVAGAVSVASFLIRPDKARSFELVSGSVFINDEFAPVGIDLATGKPTVRLVNANKQVGAEVNDQLSVVPLSGGTLLFNNGSGIKNANSGEFNMVDSTGFLFKIVGGVPLPSRGSGLSTYGFADTDTAVPTAYLERTGPGGTDVFLVSNSTVTSAVGASGDVKPRASISVDATGEGRAGAGASANGDLWLILTSGTRKNAVRFSVPAGNKTGARLSTAPGIAVQTQAALGVGASVQAGGGQVVGIAEPKQIRLISIKGKTTTRTFAAPGAVDKILPASNANDRLAFLLRGVNGWNLMSVRTDGTGLDGPTPLKGLPADDLATPAFSENALYTADLSTGAAYRIELANGSVAKVLDYPALAAEKGSTSYGDTAVIATGPRVIVNSPHHRQALAVFTDGLRSPLVIRKSSAVSILANSTAETFSQTKGGQTTQRPTGGSVPKANQPVSTRVDCTTVNQKPHVPTITQGSPGSRSVALSWNYPVIDQQDCIPSTYSVSLKVLSNGAPRPKSSYSVQGQQSVSIDGLYPSTRYELTVTAYLKTQHTTSAPFTITTGPEGPAAPTGLQVSPDTSGNWRLSWNGCGTVSSGCVTTTSWQVTPSFCDGVGLSNPPAPLNLPADPTTRAQPPTLFKGTDALLGRGLRFQVTGTGTQGQVGTPSTRSRCVYSWRTPTVAAMTLRASAPQNTSVGGSSATNVTLGLGSDPARDVGGYGATITLTLTGDGVTQTRSFVFNGNQKLVSANFGNVHPGATYTAAATVQSAHGGAAVLVPPVQVSARANWPAATLSAHCDNTGLTTCTLSVHISSVSKAATGELFDFTGGLRCGNAFASITKTGYDPATTNVTLSGLDQQNGFYNTCTVKGQLSESSSTPPLVFGGSPSPTLADTSVNLGAPVVLGAASGDFSAHWDGQNAVISYKDPASDTLRLLTNTWRETISPPGGGGCVTGNDQLNDGPATVTVPTDCIQSSNGAAGWQVSVYYNDTIGGGQRGPLTFDLPGPAPTYQQPAVCSPSGLSAVWGANAGDPIQAGYSGTDASTAGCTTWTYDVRDAGDNSVCGGPQPGPAPTQTTSVSVSIAACTATPVNGWKVHITWQDTNNATQSADETMPGDPPS